MTIIVKDKLAFVDGKFIGHVLHRTPPTMNPWTPFNLKYEVDFKMYELMTKAHIMQSLGIPLNTLGINAMMNESTTPMKQSSAPASTHKQVLLNDVNRKKCDEAANNLFGAFTWSESLEGADYWQDIHRKLKSKAEHGTSDGLSPVKFEPEIEDGYRKATKGDAGRPDRERWNSNRKIWIQAEVGTFYTDIYYQVPEDRIPTDEDAKERPTVFARDSEDDDWQKVALMRVWSDDRDYRFHCDLLDDDEYDNLKFCRFPYAGELDED